MPRYIDAERFKLWLQENYVLYDGGRYFNDIDAQPTADVVERKKGKWVYEKINSYTSRTYCSECGNPAPFICVSGDYYGRNMHGETKKTKFCPNCGAEME